MSPSAESLRAAWLIAHRLGFGTRPGELAQIAGDPLGWARAQIRHPAPVPAAIAALPSTAKILADLQARGGDDPASKEMRKQTQALAQSLYQAEVVTRLTAAAASDTPFAERWVHFFGNHFTVSVANPRILGIAGAFEREVIRPHAFGRFKDMARAAIGHPAMLCYLNNDVSMGPNSKAGKGRRGLNENLAREVLELHMLGAQGGYTQQDVTEFARILTGWSVTRLGGGLPGPFAYVERFHEPGSKTLLGKTYPQTGMAEAEAAIEDLSRHPSTAINLARRLLSHFLGEVDPAAVERLAKAYRDSDGDLAAVATALLAEPGLTQMPLRRVKSGHEYLASLLRVAPLPNPPVKALIWTLAKLGQPSFRAPAPEGFGDADRLHVTPETLMDRVAEANKAALRLTGIADPGALLMEVIGPVASSATLAALTEALKPPARIRGRKRSRPALAPLGLALSSPEFQRR